MNTPSFCRHCDRLVHVAETRAGKRQLIDVDPDPRGNVAAYRTARGEWRARTVQPAAQLYSPERRYMPHAATCPGSLA